MDDPLPVSFAPSLDLRLRMELRDGQLLLYAAELPRACALVEWPGPDGRYPLLRAA